MRLPRPYYFLEDAQIVGPFEESVILELVRTGRLAARCLCWYEGLPEWKTAGELFPNAFPTGTPASPNPTPPAENSQDSAAPAQNHLLMPPTTPDLIPGFGSDMPTLPTALSLGEISPALFSPPHSADGPGLPNSTFTPGKIIAQRYRVIRFIGRGGMGEVYEVEDMELHERVAMKSILPEYANDEAAITRFKREIYLARKITHPHVCRIFDLGTHRWAAAPPEGATDRGTFFFTMELLEGETLAQRLPRTVKVSPEGALPIVRQIAEALNAAHQRGIVHRDLKTSNIILAAEPDHPGRCRAVITDFGMARNFMDNKGPFESLSQTGSIKGTPTYMAPEQIEGGPVTASADIYALGIVIYRMITGAWPFEGDSPLLTALKRLNEAPVPPSVHLPEIPPRWETILLRCLARKPADRFPSTLHVIRALEDPSIPVEPPPPQEPFQSPETASPAWHRRPNVRILLFALLLLVLLFLVLWVGPWLRASAARAEVNRPPAAASAGKLAHSSRGLPAASTGVLIGAETAHRQVS